MQETNLIAGGWADTTRRLAGGLILLVVLSFAFAPVASAHGASHDGVRQTAQRGPAATPVTLGCGMHAYPALAGGMPGCNGSSDACPSCCGVGACSMGSATVASGPCVTLWLREISAAYGRGASREILGLQSIPDTRPPRLDA